MPFQISPGINITEKDLTTVVPNVATTIGGIVGVFNWGPALERTRITSENELVEVYGEPDADNFEYFWPAANYLAYGNNLLVVRAVEGTARNSSVVPAGTTGTGHLLENTDAYETKLGNLVDLFYAKYPGARGDSLEVLAIDGAGWTIAASRKAASVTARTDGNATELQLKELKFLENFNGAPGTSADALNSGGSNDEMHVMVIDKQGSFTNVAGEVLEIHGYVSKAVDARRVDGSNNYVLNVLNNESRYVYAGAVAAFTAANTEDTDNTTSTVGSLKSSVPPFRNLTIAANTIIGGHLQAGNNGAAVTGEVLEASYDLFDNADIVDVTLLMAGGSSGHSNAISTAKKIIDIAEARKDCVAFVSPRKASVVGQTSNTSITTAIVDDKTAIGASNYGIMDSAWKYQYDRYRDVFVNVPMNGDMAGLCARTDFTDDPWFSPAGYTRGSVKNIVKTTWEPRSADRDELYRNSVNPLVTQLGAGVILFGDKTMQVAPSAFDRINVRRLFIVLEKAISIAARQMLFEFNDPFTRAQFVNLIAPYLREIKGRRGITDFKVVCDSTNNTGQVVDTNNFVGDIFIKPTRSINFIQLNFVATRSDVSFSEVGA